MSAYNLRGGALGWGGDEQQPVARALRHDRHPGPPHPGHQRPVRYEQGHHHEDRRQVGTPSGILSSYIHPTTYRRSWRRWSRAGWGRSSAKSRRSLCSAVARTPTWCWLASTSSTARTPSLMLGSRWRRPRPLLLLALLCTEALPRNN